MFAKGTGDGRGAVAPPSGSPPRVRFLRLLNEAHVTRPDEVVLQLLERHMPAAMLAVFDADAARELYDRGKQLPGTPTRTLLHDATGVTLNGPVLGPGGPEEVGLYVWQQALAGWASQPAPAGQPNNSLQGTPKAPILQG